MENIYLIGFMGSGKSTIGKQLCEQLNRQFIDTDQQIEKVYGRDIATIFKKDGEALFRTYETNVLLQLPQSSIVSTGGGIIEKEINRNFLKKQRKVIYLQTSFATIVKRLENDTSRPLWNRNKKEKQRLFNRRLKYYLDCADYIIDTDDKSIDTTVNYLTQIM